MEVLTLETKSVGMWNDRSAVPKSSEAARGAEDSLVRRGCRRKLIHGPKFESARHRAKRASGRVGGFLAEYEEEVATDPRSVSFSGQCCTVDSDFPRDHGDKLADEKTVERMMLLMTDDAWR